MTLYKKIPCRPLPSLATPLRHYTCSDPSSGPPPPPTPIGGFSLETRVHTFYYLSLHYISVFLSTVVIIRCDLGVLTGPFHNTSPPLPLVQIFDVTTTIQARSQNIPLFHRPQILQELQQSSGNSSYTLSISNGIVDSGNHSRSFYTPPLVLEYFFQKQSMRGFARGTSTVLPGN